MQQSLATQIPLPGSLAKWDLFVSQCIMQPEHYLTMAFFSWVEYVEVDSTTEHSALSLKAQNRHQN